MPFLSLLSLCVVELSLKCYVFSYCKWWVLVHLTALSFVITYSTHFDRKMDTKVFYGRKRKDLHVREIPSDSEDSEIDSNASDEELIAEQGLSRSGKIGCELLTVTAILFVNKSIVA